VTDTPPGGIVLRVRLSVRRIRARIQGLLGVARLLLHAYTGRLHEVWIGDSHAVHINTPAMVTALRRLPDGRWVWHLGPRIMFSIAREGFPPALLRVLRMVSHSRGASEVVWAFSFGEIDVRCHLVPRMGDPASALTFVPRYLDHVQQAATLAGARRALVLVPPPESDVYPEQAGFPIVGTLEERVDASHALRDAMLRAAKELSSVGAAVHLIDVTEEFSDERGAIIEDLTYDGLHTNDAGRAVIRKHVEETIEATAKD
jgi:lysophospholipase L1-like esterase